MGAKIAVAGIIVILLGAVIGFVIYSDDIIEENGIVKYNYSIDLGSSYRTGSTIFSKQTPSSGYQFAFVTFTVKNVSYEQGFSSDYFEPILIVNGIMYGDSAIDTMQYPGYKSVTIAQGGLFTFTMVFEVPKDAVVNDMTIQSGYNPLFKSPNMVLDNHLIIE